jgi:magnesium-protoporphyrin O-methyltransferase
MSATATYAARRASLAAYFDQTAHEAWAALTSDAPVSKIRATVRAGRDRMRATLLSWLPEAMDGRTLLDAGCGTGALSVAAAARGATVTAVDLSPRLVALAQERAPQDIAGSVRFESGDMLSPAFGVFDHVVAMDSLIHYNAPDIVRALAALAPRVCGSILFTIAPASPLLSAMHLIGKAFPRADRAPAIAPVSPQALARRMAAAPALAGWRLARSERIASGFYTSHALELIAP